MEVGVDLTDERLRALVEEAERGYDLKRLHSRPRRGRPPLGSAAATVFQVRLDPQLRQSLQQRADEDRATPSEILRTALRDFLATPSSSQSPATSLQVKNEPVRNAPAVERRDVTPSPSGGWDVRKPHAKRVSSHHATKADAIQAARRILGNRGGGELLIKGRDGRVQQRATVSNTTVR